MRNVRGDAGDQVPGGHYQQQPDLSHQFGSLSLQDPAFLQELQRIETQKQFGGVHHGQHGQHVPEPVYVAQPGQPGMVAMGQAAALGSLPTLPMGGGSTGMGRGGETELQTYPISRV